MKKLIRNFWHEWEVFTGRLTREQSDFIKRLCDKEIKWGVDR